MEHVSFCYMRGAKMIYLKIIWNFFKNVDCSIELNFIYIASLTVTNAGNAGLIPNKQREGKTPVYQEENFSRARLLQGP